MTATDLVVIGRGRLLAQTTVADVVTGARGATVLVRTPEPERLTAALAAARLPVARDDADPATLVVVAETSDEVGRVAAAAEVVLLELTLRRPSLDDADLQLVAGATEHCGTTPTTDRSAA